MFLMIQIVLEQKVIDRDEDIVRGKGKNPGRKWLQFLKIP